MISLFNTIIAEEKEADIKPFDSYQEFHVSDPRKLKEEHPIADAEEKQPEEHGLGAIFEKEYQSRIVQAEAILNAARDEAEKIREEARASGEQEGYRQGYEHGREQAYEEYSDAYAAQLQEYGQEVRSLIKDMEARRDHVLEKYIDDLKNISLAVAEKIIHTSLRSSSEIIKRMIISNTEKLKKTSWAKIYIGKEQAEFGVRGDTELIRELSRLSDSVKIVVMEAEETGTCIIELPNEIIDVSAATQIENIRGILENARL